MARLYTIGCRRRDALRLYNGGIGINDCGIGCNTRGYLRFLRGRACGCGLRLPRDDGTRHGRGDHACGYGGGFRGGDGHPDTRLGGGGPIDGRQGRRCGGRQCQMFQLRTAETVDSVRFPGEKGKQYHKSRFFVADKVVQGDLQLRPRLREVAFGTAHPNLQRFRDFRMRLVLKNIQVENGPLFVGQGTDGGEDFGFGEVGRGETRFIGVAR